MEVYAMFGHAYRTRSRTRRDLLLASIATTIFLLAAAASIAAVFSFSGAAAARSAAKTAREPVDLVAFRPEAECYPAPSGMISWWAAENNANDSLGRNNAVLQGNAGFTAGKVGNAFNLDGNGDFVQVTTPTGLPVGNAPRTVEVWFRTPLSGAFVSQPIFQYGTADDKKMFGLITDNQNYLHFYGHNYDLAGNTSIQPNTWYHGAVTYNGTDLKLYLDGQVQGQGSYPLINTVLNANGITIGSRPGSDTWTGQIDEPTIYDRALSDAEVLAIYNSGSAGKCIPCAPPPPDMAGWWPGEGNTLDIQGPTFENGTLVNGAGYAAGMVGQAFSFDGINDSLVIPDHPSLDVTTGFTLEAWVNPAAPQGLRQGGIFSKVGGPGGNNGYQFVLASESRLLCLFNAAGEPWPTNMLDVTLSQPVPSGSWTHLACTYDHSSLRAYVNGVLAGSLSVGPKSVADSVSNLRISDDDNGNAPFNGRIDEPSVSHRALTQVEIAAIYNAGSIGKCRGCTPPPPNMVTWWPGDSNANDIQGPTFENGSLTNGAAYAAGKVDQAFLFDGVDSYFRANNTTSIDGGPQATYDAWVFPTAVPEVGTYFGIVGAGDSTFSSWLPQQCRLLFWKAATSPAGTAKFYIDCGLDNNENYFSRMSARDYPINTWHFVVGTFNNGTLNIYVNGVLDNGDTAGTGGSIINTASNNYVWMGAMVRNDGSLVHVPFAGMIDEAEIFDRALSAAEIQSIFSADSAGKCRVCAPPPPQMISWWDGDGTANDIIGLNEGTLMNGAAYGSGMVGQAFSLDGSNDYISVPDSASIQAIGNAVSIDAWVRPSALPSGDPYYDTTVVARQDFLQGFALVTKGDRFGLFIGNGSGFVLPLSSPVTTNTWYHVTGTFDGSTARIYVNGVLEGSQNATVVQRNFISLTIGSTLGTIRFFSGLIDEVELFGRALSAAEIQAIYNAGSAGKCKNACTPPPPNLVDWWPANGNGTDILGGQTATLANGATYSAGKVDQAFTLDGINDYASAPASSNWAFGTGDFTVEYWILPSANDDHRPIVNNRKTPASESMWALEIYPVSNRVEFHTGFTIVLTATNLLTNSGWNHVAVTRNGTVLTLYINGIPSGSASNSSNFSEVNDLQIGRDIMEGNNLGGRTFPGKIDELSIYRRALSASEITAIFDAGNAGKCLPSGSPTPTPTPTPPPTPTPTPTPTLTPTPSPCSMIVSTTADGPAGSGSLRSAVICANTTPGADIISVPAGTYMLTVTGPNEDSSATGDLDITEDLVLNGAGTAETAVNGGQADRVFDVIGSTAASFNALTITNGRSTECGPAPGLGACGGGILNRAATVNVNNSVVSSSIASIGNADGGGIFNSGGSGTLNIVNSTLIGNSSVYGGAISGGGTISVTGSTIIGNSASDYGGGIYTGGPTTIVNSTITGNAAVASGSAVLSFVSLTITNSTINGHGGGPAVDNYSGTTIIRSSILGYQQPERLDCAGTITSGGYNIESGTSCGFTSQGDRQGTNPLVGDFGNNGGPTQTYSLQVGSPAINMIPIGTNGCGTTMTVDQRGVARPQGPACDAGAYESVIQPPPLHTRADFDGDNRTDVSVYRRDAVPPNFGVWYLWRSSTGFFGIQFGIATDIITPGDFDNDNKTDIAVARLNSNGTDPDFYIINSATNTFTYPVWGNPGDIPVVADYDGDGRADVAIWRPGNATWYIQNSTGGVTVTTHGATGDRPIAMDSDGDGKANLACFRPSAGNWIIRDQTGGGSVITTFGVATDLPVPADYDGDNRDDIAVFRGGMWIILRSSNGAVDFIPFGTTGDIPVPGDYDADNRYDPAIYRQGVWHMLRSSAGYTGLGFGSAGDIPIPAGYLP